MNGIEVKDLKNKLELDITEAVSKLTKKFSEETGFDVTGIEVSIMDVRVLRALPVYRIDYSKVTVEL